MSEKRPQDKEHLPIHHEQDGSPPSVSNAPASRVFMVRLALIGIAYVLLFQPHWLGSAMKINVGETQQDYEVDKSAFGWHKCPNSNDDRWKCGSIQVPYDYKNPADKRTMKIETVLFQVGKERANSTVIVNPGGPGGSGVAFAWGAAEKISSNYTDSTFDVLGFDPRGVNASEPHISCFPNYEYSDRWASLGSYYQEKGDKRADLELWDSLWEAQFKACREKYGDIPEFLTTALVARDIDTIRAALNEEKLYYYGVSYGTGLGQTYTQMFPDRVGRVLLDGLEYIYDGRTTDGFGTAALHDVIHAYEDGFIGECIRAGPAGCALARPLTASDDSTESDTVAGLKARLDNILTKLLNRPIAATHPKLGPGIVRYKNLIDMLYSAMYDATKWPKLADAISQYERHGNGTELLSRAESSTFSSDPEQCPLPAEKVSGDAGILVICGDSYDAPHPDLDWYLNLWKDMNERSFIGGDGRFLDILPCRHFDWKPAEVYRGDLRANLSHPILLIGETYDPATPIFNGRKLYNEMGPSNARLVIHHGYGHSSRDKSECTEKIKRRYFLSGELPAGEEPTDCYADGKPYPVKDGKTARIPIVDLVELAPTRWAVPALD